MRRSRGSRPIHASTFEDTIIKDLEARGIEYVYEPETLPYDRKVRGARCAVCNSKDVLVSRRYTPDIRIGRTYIEAKGKFTAENRSKMDDFLRGNPGFDLRFIFMRDNWITKKHKTKYSDWCKKLGVKYVIGSSVPDDWLGVQKVQGQGASDTKDVGGSVF